MSLRVFLLVGMCGTAQTAVAQQRPPLLTRNIDYYNPVWRPDGRSLAFESTLEGVYSIFTINADGSDLKRLTVDSANNEQAQWSPDGARLVFSSDRAGHLDLYLMNTDGSGQRRLTTTAGGGYYQASFSPDGQSIVFQGRPDNSETRDRLYVVATDGTGFRQLTDSSYGAEGPRWSRDGRTITFLQVPYPRRLWSEMGPTDLALARAGQRRMSIRPDGSHLVPAPPLLSRDSVHSNLSPDGRQAASARVVDGWSGLYVYDVATRTERLITGGPGAGPLGYVRSAMMEPVQDTFDTFGSTRGGSIALDRNAYIVRVGRRTGGGRFELSNTWYDSLGRETARQTVRTGRGTLTTELETTRARGDSASLLVRPDHVTGWVVPQGEVPRLYDGPTTGERYAREIVLSAIARSRPAVGTLFLAPVSSPYFANPVEMLVDTIRVVRRDTLAGGESLFPVLVLERANGSQVWLEETTGAEVLSRGNAGPTRWWWHIRRGVRPPSPGQ